MTSETSDRLGELFDPKAELSIERRIRHHWSQDGAVVFATFRLNDSVPASVLQRWDREKQDWVKRHGHGEKLWSLVVPTLSASDRSTFNDHFRRTRDDFLDTCHGSCVLKRSDLAQIVADSLMHFDREEYRMGDFVIMPNHVHLLAAFPNAEQMRLQFDSWLHFTARRINQELGRRGHLWQQEPFDHLVRSLEQYAYLRDYIADNPKKAQLALGHYVYRRFGT